MPCHAIAKNYHHYRITLSCQANNQIKTTNNQRYSRPSYIIVEPEFECIEHVECMCSCSCSSHGCARSAFSCIWFIWLRLPLQKKAMINWRFVNKCHQTMKRWSHWCNRIDKCDCVKSKCMQNKWSLLFCVLLLIHVSLDMRECSKYSMP